MIYIMEKQKTKDINKNIIDYINSNLDKKFIVLTKDLAQTTTLNKKITRECICVSRKYKMCGDLNPYEVCDSILNSKDIILMHYNYLPFFYKKIRDGLDEYNLIVTNADCPLLNFREINNIGVALPYRENKYIVAETFKENGLEFIKINHPQRFIDTCLWSTRSLIKQDKIVYIVQFPSVVLNSFKNVMIYTNDFYVKLKKTFDIYCPNYHVIAPDTIDGYFE